MRLASDDDRSTSWTGRDGPLPPGPADAARAPAAHEVSARDVSAREVPLAQLARIQTLGALAASLAHELSQPLTALRTNVDAARHLLAAWRAAPGAARPDQPPGEALTETFADALGETLGEIAREERRAAALLARLRGLVRGEPVRAAPVAVGALVEEALALVAAEARLHRVTLVAELGDDLAPACGDHVQLVQVLVNLLLNAVQASATPGAGGERPSGARPVGARQVVVRAGPRAGGVELTVADDGPGLAPAVRARLFEPFVTTRPDGMGIGLWLARTLVEAHGGRLTADPARDGGACFRLWLPVAPPQES